MPLPYKVYGINLMVKMLQEAPPDVDLHCPKGSPIKFGVVVGRGDGFDEAGACFRELPDFETVVAFEESVEGVEGHYFYFKNEEYRVLHLDAVILSFRKNP
ncbi:MAG: hypothetical protein HYZ53_16880 [Planctomycetes bacterium]|nr:hypothetical protein [Planctomycetota bacterium]